MSIIAIPLIAGTVLEAAVVRFWVEGSSTCIVWCVCDIIIIYIGQFDWVTGLCWGLEGIDLATYMHTDDTKPYQANKSIQYTHNIDQLPRSQTAPHHHSTVPHLSESPKIKDITQQPHTACILTRFSCDSSMARRCMHACLWIMNYIYTRTLYSGRFSVLILAVPTVHCTLQYHSWASRARNPFVHNTWDSILHWCQNQRDCRVWVMCYRN